MDKNQSIDWRRVVSAACLKCDWTALARTARGPPELAAMVGEAFRRDIARTDAAQPVARHTMPPSPVEEPAAEAAPPPPADPEPLPAQVDGRAVEAAALLGVEEIDDATWAQSKSCSRCARAKSLKSGPEARSTPFRGSGVASAAVRSASRTRRLASRSRARTPARGD